MVHHLKAFGTMKEFIDDYESGKIKRPYVVVINDRFDDRGKPVVLYSSRGHYRNLLKYE